MENKKSTITQSRSHLLILAFEYVFPYIGEDVLAS